MPMVYKAMGRKRTVNTFDTSTYEKRNLFQRIFPAELTHKCCEEQAYLRDDYVGQVLGSDIQLLSLFKL